jgi:Zn finger protein HypA/HybF involved in hydrogenase expression
MRRKNNVKNYKLRCKYCKEYFFPKSIATTKCEKCKKKYKKGVIKSEI